MTPQGLCKNSGCPGAPEISAGSSDSLGLSGGSAGISGLSGGSSGTSGMSVGPAGIYVHVPYCIKKCRYCDFVSFEKAPEDSYFEGLCRDIKAAGSALKRPKADTVFFGGGTPSLASKGQLSMVMESVKESFEIAENAEISIEVNPETISFEKALEIKELGFNRVSMGVQSLDDSVLKAMGRVHSAERARDAFKTLRDAGFDNINLDLIFGAPCQTLEIWKNTLNEVLSMKPEHISFYSLQLEEGTPFYKDYTSGRIDLPSWEENREMYKAAKSLIKAYGYNHYEVSNAALLGKECRHNLKYWNMETYLGFGTSAHSFVCGCRGEADFSKGLDETFGLEPESENDLKGDFIFTRLRMLSGFKTEEYKALFKKEFTEEFRLPLGKLLEDGLVEICGEGSIVRLTEKGLDNTNPVMQALLCALED